MNFISVKIKLANGQTPPGLIAVSKLYDCCTAIRSGGVIAVWFVVWLSVWVLYDFWSRINFTVMRFNHVIYKKNMADMQEDDDDIIIAACWTIVSAAVGASDANSQMASQLLGSWLFTAAVEIWLPYAGHSTFATPTNWKTRFLIGYFHCCYNSSSSSSSIFNDESAPSGLFICCYFALFAILFCYIVICCYNNRCLQAHAIRHEPINNVRPSEILWNDAINDAIKTR